MDTISKKTETQGRLLQSEKRKNIAWTKIRHLAFKWLRQSHFTFPKIPEYTHHLGSMSRLEDNMRLHFIFLFELYSEYPYILSPRRESREYCLFPLTEMVLQFIHKNLQSSQLVPPAGQIVASIEVERFTLDFLTKLQKVHPKILNSLIKYKLN